DGIRDRNVTGVQTCALPIYRADDLVLPALGRVLGIHAVDQLVDVGREIVLPAVCLIPHLVQAVLLGHHCLRGSSGLACADRIVSGPVPQNRGPGRFDDIAQASPSVRARKSSAPPTSSTCPVGTSAVAIAATSEANSSTEYRRPAASRRASRAPGRARLSSVAVTVPSI